MSGFLLIRERKSGFKGLNEYKSLFETSDDSILKKG